jgi:NitT/TauT family transport system substrate-binding protein
MKTLLLLPVLAMGLAARGADPVVVRVGFFPNVTHAQGIIGCETSREGKGWFEQRLGPGVSVRWLAFNAGPSAIEAIFAGAIDLTYVGPNPVINFFIRSNGDELRVLAGAAVGGAALVVAADSPIKAPADFRGRRIATPQLGNTQDVAARSWLRRHGLKVSLTGGDATVVPVANADQLTLFRQRRVDAVWTVEPWVSRLLADGGGRIFLEQDDALTTVLVSSVKFLKSHPDLASRFAAAHAELTDWINRNPDEARRLVVAGLGAETGRPMPSKLVDEAWARLHFTDKASPEQFEALVADARSVGFLRHAIPLDRLFGDKP